MKPIANKETHININVGKIGILKIYRWFDIKCPSYPLQFPPLQRTPCLYQSQKNIQKIIIVILSILQTLLLQYWCHPRMSDIIQVSSSRRSCSLNVSSRIYSVQVQVQIIVRIRNTSACIFIHDGDTTTVVWVWSRTMMTLISMHKHWHLFFLTFIRAKLCSEQVLSE